MPVKFLRNRITMGHPNKENVPRHQKNTNCIQFIFSTAKSGKQSTAWNTVCRIVSHLSVHVVFSSIKLSTLIAFADDNEKEKKIGELRESIFFITIVELHQ